MKKLLIGTFVFLVGCSLKYGILNKDDFTDGGIICFDRNNKEVCFIMAEMTKEQIELLRIANEMEYHEKKLLELGEELLKKMPKQKESEFKELGVML